MASSLPAINGTFGLPPGMPLSWGAPLLPVAMGQPRIDAWGRPVDPWGRPVLASMPGVLPASFPAAADSFRPAGSPFVPQITRGTQGFPRPGGAGAAPTQSPDAKPAGRSRPIFDKPGLLRGISVDEIRRERQKFDANKVDPKTIAQFYNKDMGDLESLPEDDGFADSYGVSGKAMGLGTANTPYTRKLDNGDLSFVEDTVPETYGVAGKATGTNLSNRFDRKLPTLPNPIDAPTEGPADKA